MSRYPMGFALWLFDDVKKWQFWRRGEKEFATGIILADMADYPSFGEGSTVAKIAEKIADDTDERTIRQLKKSAKRYNAAHPVKEEL